MHTMYEKVVSVIAKPMEERSDIECMDLVSWFRNKSSLFRSLKADIIKDVIRHCIFERPKKDEVLIKQGDNGDRLYIILRGKMSIYVLQDKENEQEVKLLIEKAIAKGKLDRAALGQHVWTSGEGNTVGEIALIKEDCVRTASVVVDEDTDLMVVDRTLYNRSVRDVLEKEFHDKTLFVETNPLFSSWSPKMKKSLAISLKREIHFYGSPIVRQGQPVEDLYIITEGEVEILIDQGGYKEQYPEIWTEMKRLLPELLPPEVPVNITPSESLRQKKMSHKHFQMCLLGGNEIIGASETILGLKTYMENANVTRKTELLSLSKGNYQRLFMRKSANRSIEMLKNVMVSRLYLYIHRTQMSLHNASLLKYLTLKLRDPDSLKQLRSKHTRKPKGKQGKYKEYFYGAFNSRSYDKDEENIRSFLKTMGVYYITDNSLPELETSTRVLADLNAHLSDWLKRTRRKERPEFREVLSPDSKAVKRYRLEALTQPPRLDTFVRTKTIF
ncbi:uncharacterized protein LOC111135827 isoform X2 [Crassostrea virginica]|uniref:Uncharacterized protein LOC111135827 isoform X2 n=1 Tax=Crassostrea virginica TaxID=6565 RepID=A0A8B8EPT1_CRAVI|nr:uncharacterized protein LOC111135827 isoform X2 [Crassostrea virginica]